MSFTHRVCPALFVAALPGLLAAQNAHDVHARLFADLNYVTSERPIAQGFRAGQLAVHIGATLSEQLALFGEASGTATATGFNVEVERMIVRYDLSDRLKVSLGRYHTPVSYWNTTFHHGTWLQTSTGRPDLVRGGSGLVPLHFVGAALEGNLSVRQLAFSYVAALGNGRHSNLSRAGDAGDVNATRASALAASVRPPGTVPLRLGASVYFDRVTPSATVSIDERIVSGFAALEQETPEAIVEWAAIDHETSGRRTRSDSWYAQLAYRLPFAARRFKPYARVDRTNVPADDPAFTRSTMHFAGRTGGIRIDVDPAAALKIEGRRERVADSRWMHTLAVQVSITFPGFRDSRQVPVGEGGHGEH